MKNWRFAMAKMSVMTVILLVLVPMLHAQEEAAEAPKVDDATISTGLDETRVAIFKLFNEEKFSEIAEILGLNENTVKTKYFRSLKDLKGKAGYLKVLMLLVSFV